MRERPRPARSRGCVGLVLADKPAGAIPAVQPALEEWLRVGLYGPTEFEDDALRLVGE